MGDVHGTAPVFGGRRYVPGRAYSFHDLPKQVQEDLVAQEEAVEVHHGIPVESGSYRLLMVPHAQLVRTLKERMGEKAYQAALKSSEVKAIAADIEHHGLKSPPVLDEGVKRALALALLGSDMPYFTIDETIPMPPYADMPSLEGRRVLWRAR